MKKILIIEDSLFSRKRLIKQIQSAGFEVVEAGNGKDGFEQLLLEKPDCVICDLLMPIMDGFSFLEKCKTENIKTPIIIISADIQETTKQKVKSLGAFFQLNKPANKKLLLDTISRAIQG